MLVAGRYEGIDERFVAREVDEEIAIGDFVVSGGELPALMLIDAVVRQRPGVLNDAESAAQDSFVAGLLDCPHYTRPEQYDGERVPEVLLSGHHAAIRRWRLKQALGRTWRAAARSCWRERALTKEEQALLAEYQRERRGSRSSSEARRATAASARHNQKSRASGGALRCAQGHGPSNRNGERSMNIIETLEQEEIARLGKTIPDFAPGDTVIVNVSVVEGERKRVQAYEGVVIAKRNRGLNSSFVVRKISSGEGVERTFQTVFAAAREHRGQAQGRRAPREALLPARPLRQVGAHPREARASAQGAKPAKRRGIGGRVPDPARRCRKGQPAGCPLSFAGGTPGRCRRRECRNAASGPAFCFE